MHGPPTGSTHVAAVIGDPVRHSLSPALHNAAFAALDLDWVYVAFEVAAGCGARALEAMRALAIDGLSVTMPHKADVAVAVDERTPEAEALGAVNCVARRGSQLVGHNTDGPGFLDALRLDEGFDPAGKRVVVIGAGGAARAVIVALGGAGASEVGVVNRTPERGAAAAHLAGQAGRLLRPEAVADADLVVNATPVGMAGVVALHPDGEATAGGDTAMPAGPAPGSGQLAVDLIYEPTTTAWLEAARANGAAVANGLGMLIHQAAHAFRIWTGEDPPTEVMSAAAVAELAGRNTGGA